MAAVIEAACPQRFQHFISNSPWDHEPVLAQLSRDADMLVCEATFADADAALADEYGHLTAGQAGRVAAEAGARLLVLTHFSQRYGSGEMDRFASEAAEAFGGDIVIANDLDRIPVPRRPRKSEEAGPVTPPVRPTLCE